MQLMVGVQWVYSGCEYGLHFFHQSPDGREGWQLLLLQLLQTGGLNDKDKRICKNSHRHISL